MRRSVRILVAVVALAAVAGAGATVLRESRGLDENIRSVALSGTIHARVVLPAGYAASKQTRYPVVYFLHGLPANAGAYLGNDWMLDALEQAGPAILVIPQGSRGSDTDAEYLNWGAGRNWETYIARELPRYIDGHFRTIRSRVGRALVGLSAGGYGATLIGLHHLSTFSVIESWSGYFHPTDPTGTVALDRGPSETAHTFVRAIGADEKRRRTLIAFYVGRGDTRFRAENVQFDRELTAAHVPHLFELYAGGHETRLWQAHAAGWLRLALHRLAPAS